MIMSVYKNMSSAEIDNEIASMNNGVGDFSWYSGSSLESYLGNESHAMLMSTALGCRKILSIQRSKGKVTIAVGEAVEHCVQPTDGTDPQQEALRKEYVDLIMSSKRKPISG